MRWTANLDAGYAAALHLEYQRRFQGPQGVPLTYHCLLLAARMGNHSPA